MRDRSDPEKGTCDGGDTKDTPERRDLAGSGSRLVQEGNDKGHVRDVTYPKEPIGAEDGNEAPHRPASVMTGLRWWLLAPFGAQPRGNECDGADDPEEYPAPSPTRRGVGDRQECRNSETRDNDSCSASSEVDAEEQNGFAGLGVLGNLGHQPSARDECHCARDTRGGSQDEQHDDVAGERGQQ